MINAGIEILGFDGSQSYNSDRGQWEGVKVKIHYPDTVDGQNATDNPPEPGDVVIETGGVVWTIPLDGVEHVEGDVFSVDLYVVNHVPSEEVGPQFGQVTRGAIITPREGYVVPHWDSSVVAAEVARVASIVSLGLNVRENTSDMDKPVSVPQQESLNQKLDTDVANSTFARKDELGNIASRNVTVSMDSPSGGKHGDLWLKIF